MREYLTSWFSGLFYIGEIFNRAFGKYKVPIAVLVALTLAGGILEGIGINSIIPLFSFVSRESAPATDIISTNMGALFALAHVPYNIKTLVIFITGLFVLKALAIFYSAHLAALVTTSYELETRRSLVECTFGADWRYLTKQKVGHLDQLLTTATISSSNLLNNTALLTASVSNILVYSFLVLNVSFWIAVSTAVFGLTLLFVLRPLFRMTRKVSREVTAVYKELAHAVGEMLIGIKPIKSMHLEQEASMRSFGYFEHIRVANRKLAFYRNISAAMFQPISIVFVFAVFLFFYKTSTLNLGMFAVIVYSISKVFSYVQLSQSQLHLLSALAPYTQAILDYTADAAAHKEREGGGRPFCFSSTLSLRNVSFSYEQDAPTINGVTFDIHKGETIGIVGPSGGGKTTLGDLLLGILQPTSGTLTIDGTPLSEFDVTDLRRHVGYVSQDIFLLNDTIENNIRFFNKSVTHEQMVAAATAANCMDFIERMPKGFQTMVGERGTLLSVGQRQRIALARVLVRKPDILILDEATSSLDTDSEVLVQRAIENLHGKVTVVVIAHRLSTVMGADRILVVEKGNIIEEGAPQDLLKKKDSYFSNAYEQTRA